MASSAGLLSNGIKICLYIVTCYSIHPLNVWKSKYKFRPIITIELDHAIIFINRLFANRPILSLSPVNNTRGTTAKLNCYYGPEFIFTFPNIQRMDGVASNY